MSFSGSGGVGAAGRPWTLIKGASRATWPQQKEMPAGILGGKKEKKTRPTFLVGGESGARSVNYLESVEYWRLLAHNKASAGDQDQVPDDESWMLPHQRPSRTPHCACYLKVDSAPLQGLPDGELARQAWHFFVFFLLLLLLLFWVFLAPPVPAFQVLMPL